VAVAVSDLDEFATINAQHGHDAGDAVLSAWERVLESNIPAGAEVIRLGGDEYAVILPALSAENALILVDEIRGHFAAHAIAGVPEATASVGVAANPPHGATADELWRAADQALMRAKRDGRDRIAIYVEEKMVLKSNYYSRAALDRLSRLSEVSARTEASLLREALDDLLEKHRAEL
jgi:diguanylate cyclase